MNDTRMTTEPYKELFVWAYDDGQEAPECGFVCNVCERQVGDGPCPDHAPSRVPGLRLIGCDATPRHPHMWAIDSEAPEPMCLHCTYEHVRDTYSRFEHAQHGTWRRWRATHWLARKAYALGIVAGHWVSLSTHCSSCIGGIYWRGSRVYVLGWPTWKWSCLLRKRHWPRAIDLLEACAKCYPPPDHEASTDAESAGGAR